MVTVIKSPKEIAKAIPESARVVLLGECTHGTEEFYDYRAEITKYLIDTRGFSLVCVEADWPYMWHINEYIHRRRTKMYPQGKRFPEWMWQNRSFASLVEWLRKGHDNVNLFGLDCYSKDESLEELLRFLDIHNPTLATRVRFASPEEWPKLLARLQWSSEGDKEEAGADKTATPFSKLEQFSAEQNLECMIAAEEYYAKQQLEPMGSQASWNARDQHMATCLLRVKELLGNPKVIVWAHNSHVGDSTATPTGGVDFQRNETWNLGQMCRNVLDNVHIVGFYSHSGTVFASERWGGTGSVKELRPALENSFERNMHDLLATAGLGNGQALLQNADEKGDASKTKKGEMKSAYVEYPLGMFRMIHAKVSCTVGQSEDSAKVKPEIVRERYPNGVFKAVERATGAYQSVRLKTDQGDWITEFTPQRRITIHCLPVDHVHFRLPQLLPATGEAAAADGASRLAAAKEISKHLLGFPMLQRWVGVQYHPDTELESHYGEVLMGKCYDTIVFIDTTRALVTDIPEEGVLAVNPTPQAVKRLMQEYRAIMKEPAPNVHAHPLENNILEWHFVITGTQEPYKDGKYHGVLEFPPNFPMSPPSIRMLTPSGRFQTNTRICMSMSDYHPELWNPAWTVQALLIGLQSFMYEESNQIGGLQASAAERKRLAKASIGFNMRNEIYVKYFCGEEGARNPKKKTVAEGEVKGEDTDEGKPTCRFCHLPDDLVAPCNCKGSAQYVHLDCLQQWQKNVLLTQSTHPSYQTKIDEICNVCNAPFKYKAKSRREQIIEFTGKELQQRICKGNLLVTSRHSSEKGAEAIKKHPEIAKDLSHWIEGVFIIVRGSPIDYVQAVNFSRPLATPPKAMREYQGALDVLDGAISSLEHFIGGPVQPKEAFALFERRPAKEDAPSSTSGSASSGGLKSLVKALTPKSGSVGDWSPFLVKKFPRTGDLYFGPLGDVLVLIKERWTMAKERTDLKVFWGYASWGSTQLLAEMARRSWGVFEDWEGRNGLQGIHEGLRWNEVVDHMSIAKASEYSRNE